MFRAQALDPVERFPPTRVSLRRKTGDQVDIDAPDPGLTEHFDFPCHHLSRMLPAGATDLLLDERLDAETDAADSRVYPRGRLLRGNCSRRCFEGGLGPGAAGKGC